MSAEENSPVDCLRRRGQGAKRREGARECAEKIPCSPPQKELQALFFKVCSLFLFINIFTISQGRTLFYLAFVTVLSL